MRLSHNENPYGPSPKALKAITDGFEFACRYPDEHADLLIEAIAKHNGVAANQVLLGAGSGEILRVCANAFTGPGGDGEAAVARSSSPIRHSKRSSGMPHAAARRS